MLNKIYLNMAVVIVAVVGCTATIQPVKLRDLTEQEIKATHAIIVLTQAQLSGKQYRALGLVEGVSCRSKDHDPSASRSDAIFQARYWASKKNANAILISMCKESKRATPYNCIEEVVCSAEAIRVN